jgi:hypothetical protein
MRHGLAAIAGICLALIVPAARADDAPNAILVLESGKVRLCVTANAPNEPLDPRQLVDGPFVRGGNEFGTLGGNQLRVIPEEGDVGAFLGTSGLILAYTNGGQFQSTQRLHLRGDIGQIEYGRKILDEILARAVPAVTKRAQQLGGSTDGMRVTGLAVIDLNEDKTGEFLVAASSVAASESTEPGQFAGIFVVASDGATLGELIQVLGPEDTGTRLQIRLAAAGRNPFVRDGPGGWDFLIETIYERSDHDGNQTQHRAVDVRYFANGEFVKRPNLSFETCTGPGC